MDETTLAVAGIMTLVGVVVAYFSKAKKAAPKHVCPWHHCRYPLPDKPLIYKINGDTTGYAHEECPGCQNVVIWDPRRQDYVRWKIL